MTNAKQGGLLLERWGYKRNQARPVHRVRGTGVVVGSEGLLPFEYGAREDERVKSRLGHFPINEATAAPTSPQMCVAFWETVG
jgi:hypothetical protein